MKAKNQIFAAAFFLAALGLLSSCNEEALPSSSLDESTETAQEVDLTATMEDIDEITLSGFQRNGFSDRTLVTLEEDLCQKVNISWLPGEKKMIIDFGDGCTSPRGVVRKGKIIVTYTGRYWSKGTVITTRFENFYLDERKIEGVRVVTNEGFNEHDKFFTFKTVVEGGKITWPDGSFRTFEARHSKRVYLPNGDRGMYYAITGGSKGVNRNGNAYEVKITSPLVYLVRCIQSGNRVPSRGIMTVSVEGRGTIEIDFGTETCDREVSITRNGETKTISVPRS